MEGEDWGAVLRGTDWALLRQQKAALVGVTMGRPVDARCLEMLAGLLHFIDSVQDSAALTDAAGGEAGVFGRAERT